MGDHMPHEPLRSSVYGEDEKWTRLHAQVNLNECKDRNDSVVDPSVLYSQAELSKSESLAFIEELVKRANEEFLNNIPRYALAQAYAFKAMEGRDMTQAIIDCLISLQLFPLGTQTSELQIQVRDLVLNLLKINENQPNTHGGSPSQ
ncbi:hypothetical protein MSAN_00972400 [Mycena sanguinolenta]|uniref:Uncharacterized protein n=1 Tax=Mycena sanguinolenta TaxID=230812 RepID=A0A8H6YXP5_9AGAR|nr:hypothetical protein MSAN_00972400 [Mycena sanguinolenta]